MSDNSFKLECVACKTYLPYSRFPTSPYTKSGREDKCTNCKNGIKLVKVNPTCPMCGRK